ncbi:hypothetical protein DT73_02400 [Mangrovibacter sp. MFB070]|uniref:efflux transporter outer membrane subunit n=1 Tax=Mangrovibacter sp. MFB070 TaxID=1224318 RepID=UPI0004D6A447|nr:efflux transporter outer membrane subunit [Mangrovibacter sp. MFB070]KEA54242.1 hypothetical protein DT73_02400 [Mangrovibacter sp. MFB070]
MLRLITLLLLLPALSGCGAWLRHNAAPAEISLPPNWRASNTGVGYLENNENWWHAFGDPQLSGLIAQVLTHNSDLVIAGLQLRQSRLGTQLVNTNLTPDVGASASASNSRQLRSNTPSVESYSAGFSLSYELDLWGKLARTREQSHWSSEASAEDLQNTILMLIGTTAQHYWNIARLNQLITLHNTRLQLAERTSQLVETKYQAGVAGERDRLTNQQTLLAQRHQLRTLGEQLENARNALALIYNQPNLNQAPEIDALDTGQDIGVPLALPVEVIARRPDVRAAEWRLRATLAGNDVARLSFFPSLTLGASLNAGHTLFSQWFSNQSLAQSLTTSLPFLQWRTVQLTIAQSELEVKQAEESFRKQVLSALVEVEDALAQRETSHIQRENQRTTLAISQQLLVLTQSQYDAGQVALQVLLDAQDNVLNQQISLIESQYSYLTASMKLWQAIGGGETQSTGEKES